MIPVGICIEPFMQVFPPGRGAFREDERFEGRQGDDSTRTGSGLVISAGSWLDIQRDALAARS